MRFSDSEKAEYEVKVTLEESLCTDSYHVEFVVLWKEASDYTERIVKVFTIVDNLIKDGRIL